MAEDLRTRGFVLLTPVAGIFALALSTDHTDHSDRRQTTLLRAGAARGPASDGVCVTS
jgi:hypothetical protein